MTPIRLEVLKVLEALSQHYPDLRFGQLVINIANWATHIPDGLWDVEDKEFLDAARKHLQKCIDKRAESIQVGKE